MRTRSILIILASLLLAFSCSAETIIVDPNGSADFITIQEAISAAAIDGDIIIIREGTYNEGLDLQLKNITLTSTDPNNQEIVDNTIVTGFPQRLSNLGSITNIKGITFNNCSSTVINASSSAENKGTIQNCIFNNNFVVIDSFNGLIDNCLFEQNSNVIYSCEGISIQNSIFIDNTGKVFYNCGNCVIKASVFDSNRDEIFSDCEDALISKVIFTNNERTCFSSQWRSIIENSIFAGNKSRVIVAWQEKGASLNCVFVGNQKVFDRYSGIISNCIIYLNAINFDSTPSIPSYSCIDDYNGGIGNFSTDPLFVDAGHWYYDMELEEMRYAMGDYHLKSQAGRWDTNSQNWVYDDVTSPCIDAGNPYDLLGEEPLPNGGIINMGVYGDTAEASKSTVPEFNICDFNGDGIVNLFDFSTFCNNWLWQSP